MTEHRALEIVKFVLMLRAKGIDDNEQIVAELEQYFKEPECDFNWALEMISTGAFRATVISGGGRYPKSNIGIEDDPIMKAAFKLHWIELKGEQHFIDNYRP